MSVRLAKRLVEPDYWTCPHGKRTRPIEALTYGPEVADLCAKAGFEPDAQQELGLDLIFAIRPDGTPATFEFCVICCRRNLKTGLLKQTALGWLFVTEQTHIVWSAHELFTANEARLELAAIIESAPFLSKHLQTGPNHGIYDANGQERIELATGARLLFKARTLSGGRGLGAPKLILDEAFAVKSAMQGSLLPLVMTYDDGQIIYASSAGKEDSEALHDLKERGRGHLSPRLTYLEWLAPREKCGVPRCRHPKNAVDLGLDCALDREHLIIKANPTISTGRITLKMMRDLRQAMPPPEYARECLGWWDEPVTNKRVIPEDVWKSRIAEGPGLDVPPDAIGVDMSHDQVIAIAGCWRVDEEQFHVELLEVDIESDSYVAEEYLADAAKPAKIPVLIAADSPAAEMVPALKKRRVRVTSESTTDMAKGCGLVVRDVYAGRLTHAGQEQLDNALKGAKKRAVRGAGLWEWDPRDPSINVSSLRAMTLARLGAETARTRTGTGRSNGNRTMTSGRRTVVRS